LSGELPSLLEIGPVDADAALGLVALVLEGSRRDKDAALTHFVQVRQVRSLSAVDLLLSHFQGALASPKQDEREPVEFHRSTSYQATGM
jgi:hypothetical protein